MKKAIIRKTNLVEKLQKINLSGFRSKKVKIATAVFFPSFVNEEILISREKRELYIVAAKGGIKHIEETLNRLKDSFDYALGEIKGKKYLLIKQESCCWF